MGLACALAREPLCGPLEMVGKRGGGRSMSSLAPVPLGNVDRSRGDFGWIELRKIS